MRTTEWIANVRRKFSLSTTGNITIDGRHREDFWKGYEACLRDLECHLADEDPK